MAKKKSKKLDKTNKNVKKENTMSSTKKMKAIGESYTRNQKVLGYGAVILIGLFLCLLLKVPLLCEIGDVIKIPLLPIVLFIYFLATPKIMFNMKKRSYEKRRFDDANAYLSQMSQSFTHTKNILASLKETEATFLPGRMKNVLGVAIDKIENTYTNMRQTQIEALEIIADAYDCEKVRNTHDFLIRAEVRGGDCVTEFRVLEKIRMAWRGAVLKFHSKLASGRNLVTFEFAALLCICAFLLRNFPDMVDLIGNPLIQIVNAVEILLLLLIFIIFDGRMNGSLLRDAVYMSDEKVRQTNDYISNYNTLNELKRNFIWPVLAIVVSIVFLYVKPTIGVGVFCAVIIVAAFMFGKIKLMITMALAKEEVQRAFPRWLFDILLMMQTESVESSIMNSVGMAPPILKPELIRIVNMLDEKPGNPDAYMSFLAMYKIPGVEDTMRKLYSLSVGTGDKAVMDVVIDSNMSTLQEAEEKNMNTNVDLSSMNTFIPFALAAIAFIAYFAVLMIQVFSMLTSTIAGVNV